MLYRLIKSRRDQWLSSGECTVTSLIHYMEQCGKLRDAQQEAIKTWLFLKIACQNKPLWQLMSEGRFNLLSSDDLDEMPIKSSARDFLKSRPEALALYEYARSKDDSGFVTAPELAKAILDNPAEIDYSDFIKSLFYGVTYSDYLFSLPMGAGKTWLMAAFLYLNLYFSLTEPDNSVWASNFVVVAPAGLKSSIIPSLRDMKEFDPSGLIPEPAASQIKRLLKFEILDSDNTAKSSNRIQNPNAQKVAFYLTDRNLRGLVLITNAEKLYDKIDKSDLSGLGATDDDPRARTLWQNVRLANELRETIALLPNLCVMVDEVHHASEDQLLRKVVDKWACQPSFNSMLGFSGTPYLSSPEKIRITPALTVKNSMLANVVEYYPLADAIGNFLKIPEIKSSDLSTEDILQNGVREFLDKFRDVSYPGVGPAKMAVYCNSIESLEKSVLPIIASICTEYSLDPDESILKYYLNDNKGGYKCPPDSEARFRALDSGVSKVRFVLLVRIGKEGWNCRSLTGVILPSENSSAKNMVLQTTCRCLREVVDSYRERALIWLNRLNEKKLDDQLRKEHHTSVSEIQKPKDNGNLIVRHSRQNVVNLPELSYLQLRFNYKVSSTGQINVAQRLDDIIVKDIAPAVIYSKDLKGNRSVAGQSRFFEESHPMEFNRWLSLIAKESFLTLPMQSLMEHEEKLRKLFLEASETGSDGIRRLRNDIGQQQLRAQIIKCFASLTKIEFSEELIPRHTSLLRIENLNPCFRGPRTVVYPEKEADVMEILRKDMTPQIPEHLKKGYDLLMDAGNPEAARDLIKDYIRNSESEDLRTYHYIPYTFDSSLERNYYANELLNVLKDYKDIEVYFNGDDSTTDFYIDCYSNDPHLRRNIGRYYPDFLILKRSDPATISKVVIVETKGTVYEDAFKEKKDFMKEFIEANRQHGSTLFDFLYIPESMEEEMRLNETKKIIKEFLNN